MDLVQLVHLTGADEVICGHCKYKFIERKAKHMIMILGKAHPVCPKCGLSKFCFKKKQ